MKKLVFVLLSIGFACLAQAQAPNIKTIILSSSCSFIAAPTGGAFNPGPTWPSWVTSQLAAFSLNAIKAPDCSNAGAVMLENSATNLHQITRNPAIVTAIQTYTETIYIGRAVGSRNIQLDNYNSSGFTSNARLSVDLGTCTISVAASVSGAFINPSATAARSTLEYCKITLTWTGIVDTSVDFFFNMLNGTTASYAGDSTSSVKIWGMDFR